MKKFKCVKHPKYTKTKPPTSACKACWKLWEIQCWRNFQQADSFYQAAAAFKTWEHAVAKLKALEGTPRKATEKQ